MIKFQPPNKDQLGQFVKILQYILFLKMKRSKKKHKIEEIKNHKVILNFINIGN